MTFMRISYLALTAFVIASCSPSKKAVKPQPSATPVATAPVENKSPYSIGPGFPSKSADGVYVPGDAELIAIQLKHKETTLETLIAGHSLYISACANCHEAMNIYRYSETNWPGIIDRMAPLAKLTDMEKDAVYKYVLSIKATQP